MASSTKHPLEVNEGAPGELAREDQLRDWMVEYGPGVRRFLLKRVPSSEVDDLVQEVFLSLQARGGGVITNVEGYLFRTAVSVLSRQHRRKTWRWGRQEALNAAHDGVDEITPERVLLSREAMERLSSALRRLPTRRAEAFVLSRFHQLSNEEVARRMGISVKSVEELLRNAMQQLLAELGPDRWD